MIEKIKTITYAIRSHGYETALNKKGKITILGWQTEEGGRDQRSKGEIKKYIGHLQDVLKCLKQIEKEKAEKKVENSQDNIPKP